MLMNLIEVHVVSETRFQIENAKKKQEYKYFFWHKTCLNLEVVNDVSYAWEKIVSVKKAYVINVISVIDLSEFFRRG